MESKRILKKHKVDKVAMEAAPESRETPGHSYADSTAVTGRRRQRRHRPIESTAMPSSSKTTEILPMSAVEETEGRVMLPADYVFPSRTSSCKKFDLENSRQDPGVQRKELTESECKFGSTSAVRVEDPFHSTCKDHSISTQKKAQLRAS